MKSTSPLANSEPVTGALGLRKDLLRYLPAKTIPPLVSIATIIALVRILPPEELGRYVVVHVSAIMAGESLALLWGSAAIRFLPEDEVATGELFRTLMLLAAAASGLILGIGYVTVAYGSIFVAPQNKALLFAGFVLASLYLLYEVVLHLLNAQRLASSYAAFSIARIVLGPILGVSFALFFAESALSVIWGYSTATALTLIPLVIVNLPSDAKVSRFSGMLARKITVFGLPLLASSLLAWLLGISDRYIIGIFKGSEQIAIYSLAYSLSNQPLNLIYGLVALTGWPLVVNAWEQQGQKPAQDVISRLIRLYLLFALPTVAALWLVAKPALRLVATPEYHAGFSVVPFVAFGTFIFGMQRLLSTGPLLHKVTHLSLLATLLATVLNIGLNILLVPKYGYPAAAVVTLVSYTFFLIITPLVTRNYLVWAFPVKPSLNIVLATVAAIFVASGARIMLGDQPPTIIILALLGIGGATYLSTLLLLKEIGLGSRGA